MLLIGVLFVSVCCGTEKENELIDDVPDKEEVTTGTASLSLTQTGTQGIVIRDLTADFVQEVNISRSGADVSAAFTLTPWTESELETYNSERGTQYRLLPADAYSLNRDGSVAQGETSLAVPVTIRVQELEELLNTPGNEGAQYVLPLRLASEAATVQDIRSEVLLLVSLYIPQVSFVDAGTYNTYFLEEEETKVELHTRLMIGSSLTTADAAFDYSLVIPDNAESLVEEYNRIHGTAYKVMPAGSFTSEATFAAGESNAVATLTMYRSKVGDDIYMLPLYLEPAEGANVQRSSELCYVLTGKHFYTNPIIRQSVPDPTVLHDKDGYFYLYGTEDLGWIPVFRSADLVNWERMPKDCFQTQDSRPYWGETPDTSARSLWAPEIRYINGQYVLYYSWAIWGNTWHSEVGVAVSDSPTGPFTDRGQVIDAQEMNVNNSIDQFEFEENGQRYLFWGSFHGIYVTELNDDGLSVKRNADGTPTMTARQVAGSAYEGTCIYKRGNWYYLFASIGSCCEGANSTYQTVVGRSDNLFGPYVNKKGESMLNNRHEVLLSAGNDFVGTGHNSIIQHDDGGQAWIIFHGYVRAEADNGRYVLLERLLWDEDGWPYVVGGTPSVKALAPVFND